MEALFEHRGEAPSSIPRRVLVHMCCGPCSIMPLKTILKGSAEVWGFFHNPNIHPRAEFEKRLGAVKTLARLLSIDLICHEDYLPAEFIKGMKKTASQGEKFPPKGKRCSYCYSVRLEETAKAARDHGFDAFSTSLLYSKYQNHDEIRSLGAALAEKYGLQFYYEDFRNSWQEGIDASKEAGLYRQKYCGCVYSRLERYSRKNKIK